MDKHINKVPKPTRTSVKSIIKSRLIPFFGEYTFFQINRLLMVEFVLQLRNLDTGEPLGKKRTTAIMTEMRRLCKDSVREHHWAGLISPLENISDYYPKPSTKKRTEFRFGEFQEVKGYMDVFYHPIVEFMLLTGAIPSEVAALKRHHLVDGCIHFQESHVDKYHDDDEVGTLKEDSRNRKMPITKEIQKRLDVLLARSNSEFVVVMKNGGQYRHSWFRERIWHPAAKRAGVEHVPYEIRHTFTAWCHIAGLDMIRIVSLMGHGSKKQVEDTYGFYVEGLEDDRPDIIEFFGDDFVKSKEIIEQPLRPTRRKKVADYRREHDERL